jgi:hypothetical protein
VPPTRPVRSSGTVRVEQVNPAASGQAREPVSRAAPAGGEPLPPADPEPDPGPDRDGEPPEVQAASSRAATIVASHAARPHRAVLPRQAVLARHPVHTPVPTSNRCAPTAEYVESDMPGRAAPRNVARQPSWAARERR